MGRARSAIQNACGTHLYTVMQCSYGGEKATKHKGLDQLSAYEWGEPCFPHSRCATQSSPITQCCPSRCGSADSETPGHSGYLPIRQMKLSEISENMESYVVMFELKPVQLYYGPPVVRADRCRTRFDTATCWRLERLLAGLVCSTKYISEPAARLSRERVQ